MPAVDVPPDAPVPPRLSPLAAAALAIVPALSLGIGAAVAWSAIARWVPPFFDPDYHYLLNAMSIAEGHAPHHIDHPGTTLQELGAAVLLVRHALTGTGPLRMDVLRDPEPALTAISLCLRALVALALYLLGLR